MPRRRAGPLVVDLVELDRLTGAAPVRGRGHDRGDEQVESRIGAARDVDCPAECQARLARVVDGDQDAPIAKDGIPRSPVVAESWVAVGVGMAHPLVWGCRVSSGARRDDASLHLVEGFESAARSDEEMSWVTSASSRSAISIASRRMRCPSSVRSRSTMRPWTGWGRRRSSRVGEAAYRRGDALRGHVDEPGEIRGRERAVQVEMEEHGALRDRGAERAKGLVEGVGQCVLACQTRYIRSRSDPARGVVASLWPWLIEASVQHGIGTITRTCHHAKFL